jgi:hypothetical protein
MFDVDHMLGDLSPTDMEEDRSVAPGVRNLESARLAASAAANQHERALVVQLAALLRLRPPAVASATPFGQYRDSGGADQLCNSGGPAKNTNQIASASTAT